MKNFKNILILGVFILVSTSIRSQSIFDKYASKDEVTSVVISENMFKLFATMQLVVNDKETQDFIDIAKNVKGLRVLTTSNSLLSDDLKNDALNYVRSKKLSELLVLKDKGSSVYFYTADGFGKGKIKELLMLVTEIKEININGRNFETILLSLTGDLDIEKIGVLANKMNLPKELGRINSVERQ